MPINKLALCNFKGVRDSTEFDIKPITLFIGPNSSGKSSCLHGLAALSQTVKLAQSKRPIILDDEYAQVHLGRFIEVIHSKSYSDAIQIGIAMDAPHDITYGPKTVFAKAGEVVRATYTFKSTKRTQEVFVEQCDLLAGKTSLSFKRNPKSGQYGVAFNGKPVVMTAVNVTGLKFSVSPFVEKNTGPQAKKKAMDEGVHSIRFEVLLFNELIGELVASELRRTLYLGPFRQSPLRRYPTRGATPSEVGAEGEAAVTLLANENVQSKTRVHKKQISGWFNSIGLAKSVDVSRVGASDLFDVSVTLPDGVSLPIADLGYGVSQALPVLAQCSFAPNGSTLLFEQPELHLHPAAAERLASVLVQAAKSKNLRVVAETHSRELFHRVMKELKAGNLQLDDISAYVVERKEGKSLFKKIKIENDDGHFEVYDPWDKGLVQI